MDMDETMIHFILQSKQFIIRPGLIRFLTTLNDFADISVFTAGTQSYADPILNIIEQMCGFNIFKKRLYRNHAVLADNGSYIKDIKKYFNIDNSILIDDNFTSISMFPNNSFYTHPFYGDPRDSLLSDLLYFLINFTVSGMVSDEYVKKTRPYLEDLGLCIPFN